MIGSPRSQGRPSGGRSEDRRKVANGSLVGPVLLAATFLSGLPEPNTGSAAGRNDGGGARTLTVSVACLAP